MGWCGCAMVRRPQLETVGSNQASPVRFEWVRCPRPPPLVVALLLHLHASLLCSSSSQRKEPRRLRSCARLAQALAANDERHPNGAGAPAIRPLAVFGVGLGDRAQASHGHHRPPPCCRFPTLGLLPPSHCRTRRAFPSPRARVWSVCCKVAAVVCGDAGRRSDGRACAAALGRDPSHPFVAAETTLLDILLLAEADYVVGELRPRPPRRAAAAPRQCWQRCKCAGSAGTSGRLRTVSCDLKP